MFIELKIVHEIYMHNFNKSTMKHNAFMFRRCMVTTYTLLPLILLYSRECQNCHSCTAIFSDVKIWSWGYSIVHWTFSLNPIRYIYFKMIKNFHFMKSLYFNSIANGFSVFFLKNAFLFLCRLCAQPGCSSVT